ncbi:MAG TPA: peptidylprolyl isomerase [Planctomycetota bacterium]|nr:peptidylprolyl isomerase [Planctomycetota bacterium]
MLGLTLCLLPSATATPAAPAAPAAAADDSAPVLVIDGKPISRATYKDFLFKQFGANPKMLEQYVNNYLVDLEAKEQGISPTEKDAADWIEEKIQATQTNPEYKRFNLDPAELRRQYKPYARQFLVIETLIKRHRVNVDELRKEYEERYGEKRKVRHILFAGGAKLDQKQLPTPEQFEAAKKQADEACAALAKGADFEKLAKEQSDDKGSGAEGGDLGDVTRATAFVPEFLEAAFKLKEGEVSAPVKSQYGYHVIQVVKVTPPAKPFDDEAKKELSADALKRDVQGDEEDLYYRELRKKHKVETKIE